MLPLVLLALALQIPSADQLSDQALALAGERKFAEAAALWEKAIAISPDHFSSLFNLGYFHQSTGDLAKAEVYLTRAASVRPKDFNTRYLLGVVLFKAGQSEGALRQWRAALALNPRNTKLMQIMAAEYSKGHYFRDAAAVASQALELQKDDPNIHLLAIKAWQDAGDHPSALKVAEQLIKAFPELPRANFEYGFELYRAGQPGKAIPYLEKAMKTAPDYEEPPFFYGEILLREGRYKEAVPYLRRAIEIRSDYMAARMALVRALMGVEDYADAAAEVRKAIDVDPRHPQPHLLLSQIHYRLGDEAAAKSEKDLSMRLRRENPTAMEAPQSRPFPSASTTAKR